MSWQLNLSNSLKWWVTSELMVDEWCGDLTKVRRFDLKILVLVEIDKIKLNISKCISV